jgi:hypothetical protein
VVDLSIPTVVPIPAILPSLHSQYDVARELCPEIVVAGTEVMEQVNVWVAGVEGVVDVMYEGHEPGVLVFVGKVVFGVQDEIVLGVVD